MRAPERTFSSDLSSLHTHPTPYMNVCVSCREGTVVRWNCHPFQSDRVTIDVTVLPISVRRSERRVPGSFAPSLVSQSKNQ